MPRYELVGSASTFWEIELRGTSFVTRWGRLGDEGQSKSHLFANVETASYEYEQQISSKENDGYQLKVSAAQVERVAVRLEDGSGTWRELELRGAKVIQRSPSREDEPQESSTRFDDPKEAKDQFDFLISRYLRQGHKEVSRSSGRVEQRTSALALVSHPEYEAACFAAPGDLRPWQIYADWLQEHGDVRGEVAALFLGRKASAAWKRLDSERDALLGPHAESELYDLVITNGFITGATLKRATRESVTHLALLTSDFLARPAARFVSELTFGLADCEHRRNDWTETVKALCYSPQAKQLRQLEFNAFSHQEWDLSSVAFGDFSPIWAGLPELEHLHLRAGATGTLGRIEHPKLQTLIRDTGNLPRGEADAILKAKCPALERLEIRTGTGDAGVTSDQFAEMIREDRFPRLNQLAVVSSEFTVELVRALEKSALLGRLRVLDLSKGSLTDGDVDVLLRAAPKFAHVRLDLSENYLSHRLDELRRALPRAMLEDQRDESERYDEAGE